MGAITHLIAGVPVSDLDAGIDWYSRFFGREPDMRAGNEILWDVDAHATLFIEPDAARAGTGRITFAVDRTDAPRLLVVRIADPDLPFGGTWTYAVSASSSGSSLTITEDGAIYNPLFRVLSRFVFGYESTLATYLKDVGAKLASAQPGP